MTTLERNKRRALIVRRHRAMLAGELDEPRHRMRSGNINTNDETTERAGWDDPLDVLPDAG